MKEDDREAFEALITRPPKGAAPSQQLEHASGVWSRDAELAQFKQASG